MTAECFYATLSGRHYILSIIVVDCKGNTYGIGCKNCSDNCRNRKCMKLSETLICKQGCVAGKTGLNCSIGKNNYYFILNFNKYL